MNVRNDGSNLPKWKTTSSRYIVNDQWLKLRADTCLNPDGKLIEPWYVIESNDWISCLVIDNNNQVLMERHYRHAYVLETVCGITDNQEVPLDTTTRELKEEIGYQGGQIYHIGTSYVNPANQTHKLYSFLAVGGSCDNQTNKESTEQILVEGYDIKDFLKLIKNPRSEMFQSLHLATIFMALNFIENQDAPKELKKLKELFLTN